MVSQDYIEIPNMRDHMAILGLMLFKSEAAAGIAVRQGGAPSSQPKLSQECMISLQRRESARSTTRLPAALSYADIAYQVSGL
jgi:hypothetical protein